MELFRIYGFCNWFKEGHKSKPWEVRNTVNGLCENIIEPLPDKNTKNWGKTSKFGQNGKGKTEKNTRKIWDYT